MKAQLKKWIAIICIITCACIGLYLAIVLIQGQHVSDDGNTKRTHLNLFTISQSVKRMQEELGRSPTNAADLLVYDKTKGGNMLSDVLLIEPNRKMAFSRPTNALPIGRIIIIGRHQDEDGFVWALTDSGIVLKVDSKEASLLRGRN